MISSPFVIEARNQTKSENDSIIETQDNKNWPCPLAEDIAPCTCSYKDSRISMLCQNVVELSEIERIFSQHFPFPKMGIRNIGTEKL